MNKRNSLKLTSMVLLAMLAASACTQTYSQAPLGTPTLIPTGLFVSPFPSGQDPLKIVADLGTQTAVAKTAQAGGGTSQATAGTPATATATATGPTPTLGTPATASATTAAAATTAAPVTVVPNTRTATPASTVVVPTYSGSRPASYTMHQGEFVYCIARRFNVNPDDVLSMNNLSGADTIYPGLALTIPQTGSFPGDRAWHSHPDTYTVSGSNDSTLFAVACYYGDVYPEAIASANNVSLSSTLTIGQRLTIP